MYGGRHFHHQAEYRTTSLNLESDLSFGGELNVRRESCNTAPVSLSPKQSAGVFFGSKLKLLRSKKEPRFGGSKFQRRVVPSGEHQHRLLAFVDLLSR